MARTEIAYNVNKLVPVLTLVKAWPHLKKRKKVIGKKCHVQAALHIKMNMFMIDTNLPIQARLQNNLLLIYFEKTFSLTTIKPFSTKRTKNGTIKLSKFCKNQTRNSLTLKKKSDFFPDLCKLHSSCSRQKVYFSKLCSKKYTDITKKILVVEQCLPQQWTVMKPQLSSPSLESS